MRSFLPWSTTSGLCRRRPTGALQYRSLSRIKSRTDFQALDAKWQAIWPQVLSSVPTSKKKYVLPMFAYPSGKLHMGHLRVYTISDVLARYNRMKGYDVLHPTGWDAFGLPAENAAIERGIDPAEWTNANIEVMKGQLKSMNTYFNWENEISTCSPEFYKHTQKLFLMLYRKGLAYQAEALVNYDPIDQTVLANEQVDGNGRSWRSGAVVEQRMLRQWFLKITAFQDALLDDLDTLSENDRWPDRVIQQQKNWIGRSKGANIAFELLQQKEAGESINVFTTRPDTLFGVQYLALSLSHPLVESIARSNAELSNFLRRRSEFAPDSKEGFELPVKAINPLSSTTSGTPSSIPIFAAPYVLDGYGEGAVMGVPAHDSRDWGFWKFNKPDMPARVVIAPENDDIATSEPLQEAYTGHGVLTSACGPYAGMNSRHAALQIVDDLQAQGLAHATQTWRLRDWLISRQRYWGAPIPIVHCSNCGPVAVPDDQLPVQLPALGPDVQGQRGNPLDKIEDFVKASCPSCGKEARRETDTMDTFVDSSWYYARFPDNKNLDQIFSSEAAARNLPVDMYIGGIEHAILHLLYSRFIYKFLCQEGFIPHDGSVLSTEPFSRLIAQGLVHGKTYSDPESGRFLKPEELQSSTDTQAMMVKSTGKEAVITWEKMSKSKHNGVDPLVCFQKYGADVTRAHMLFAAPLSEVLQWDEEKVVGVQRWLYRLSRFIDIVITESKNKNGEMAVRNLESVSEAGCEILLLTNTTLRNVTNTIENNVYNINTVVSDLIKLTNALFDTQIDKLELWVSIQTIDCLIKMLAPIAPAFAEQSFEDLQESGAVNRPAARSIFTQGWPEPLLSAEEEAFLTARRKTITCAVQVNGKFRFSTNVPTLSSGDKSGSSKEHEERVVTAVLKTPEGQLWLKERNNWDSRKRVILVGGGKLLNVVF